MNESLRAGLEALARDVFQDPGLTLTPTTTARQVPGWDSLGHVNFMYSIEQAFGITFTDEEFTSAPDVGALERLLEQKGAGSGAGSSGSWDEHGLGGPSR